MSGRLRFNARDFSIVVVEERVQVVQIIQAIAYLVCEEMRASCSAAEVFAAGTRIISAGPAIGGN